MTPVSGRTLALHPQISEPDSGSRFHFEKNRPRHWAVQPPLHLRTADQRAQKRASPSQGVFPNCSRPAFGAEVERLNHARFSSAGLQGQELANINAYIKARKTGGPAPQPVENACSRFTARSMAGVKKSFKTDLFPVFATSLSDDP